MRDRDCDLALQPLPLQGLEQAGAQVVYGVFGLKTHAKLARVVEVAKSREGRSVWAIEIANPAGTPVAERPALMIAANFEGDQLIGSQLALYIAEHLLTGYGTSADIKALAGTRTQVTDMEGRTVRVGAGVVLDQLNQFLQPHGLCFGPDVATSSRAICSCRRSKSEPANGSLPVSISYVMSESE